MTMAKHTPGPWTYGMRRDRSIWLSLGDPTKGSHYQGDLVSSEGDARLIAAAPELLAALKDAIRMLDAVRYSAGLGTGQMKRVDDARAALAKAEGPVTP